jgi:parvulin-like peptidyl-prolyl isomerase
MMNPKARAAWLICGLLAPMGCADSRPRPLDAEFFVPPTLHDAPHAAAEPASTVAAAELSVDAPPGESPKNATVLPSTAPAAPVFDSVPPLDPVGATTAIPPTTEPSQPVIASAAIPASARLLPANPPAASPTPSGVYMMLGGVIAQVNNTPIYANQVLTPLHKEFAAKAREFAPEEFREFAQKEIGRQLQELIEDELYFATAFHALSEEDRKIAEAITMDVRAQRVTAAGGSVQKARQNALEEDGVDLDEAMKQEYRRIVHEIYQRRKIEPLIQVTADNMREFYRLNVAKLYSQKDQAQFRVIKIDPKIAGGKQAALDKINTLHNKATAGEDFAKLASSDNDDSYLKTRGGNPCDEGGWMDRNTYRIDEVEAAVWQLQPGQVTPVIEAGGAFYIAKLLAKHDGVVKPFEDLKVQDDIYNRLRQKQMGELWRKSTDESVNQAMVITDEKRLQVALDMAMQSYSQMADRR